MGEVRKVSFSVKKSCVRLRRIRDRFAEIVREFYAKAEEINREVRLKEVNRPTHGRNGKPLKRWER
jgi:hypothetical protein